MIDIIRCNDIALLFIAESLLKEAGIPCFVADTHTSLVEGSMGFIQKRLMVRKTDVKEAAYLLTDAGLGKELRHVE